MKTRKLIATSGTDAALKTLLAPETLPTATIGGTVRSALDSAAENILVVVDPANQKVAFFPVASRAAVLAALALVGPVRNVAQADSNLKTSEWTISGGYSPEVAATVRSITEGPNNTFDDITAVLQAGVIDFTDNPAVAGSPAVDESGGFLGFLSGERNVTIPKPTIDQVVAAFEDRSTTPGVLVIDQANKVMKAAWGNPAAGNVTAVAGALAVISAVAEGNAIVGQWGG